MAASGRAGRLGLARLGALRLLVRLALCSRFRLLAAELLPALDRLLDRPDHVERLLGQLVVLAVEDLGEAADRVLELHVLARRAGELLGHEERLREEALDLARARDDELVLVRELVDAEDGDDVLQVGVALQHLLHAGRAVR